MFAEPLTRLPSRRGHFLCLDAKKVTKEKSSRGRKTPRCARQTVRPRRALPSRCAANSAFIYRRFIPRRAFILPPIPATDFIILRESSNCLIRRFTSTSEQPLPAAMRCLRLGLSTDGFSRS